MSVGGQPAKSPEDAEYFLRWIDRIIASADARQDYNDAQEKKDTHGLPARGSRGIREEGRALRSRPGARDDLAPRCWRLAGRADRPGLSQGQY